MRARGADCLALRAFRELDDALLRLRFNEEQIGLVLLRTRGDAAARKNLLAVDATLAANAGADWFTNEIVLHMARVLRRLDLTARSLFAVLDPGSCFAGPLLELALAADRSYMLDDASRPVTVSVGLLSGGALPMTHGPTRLAARFYGEPTRADAALSSVGQELDAEATNEAGLVTVLADEIDFDDELRVAIEERVSLSPDALTGMEASLRCVGNESGDSKIFGRLSAWQNWIFIRPNATGEKGALSLYGKPERPVFDWRRT
jgi:benzoyl-CoA-dihydrodiol lyase